MRLQHYQRPGGPAYEYVTADMPENGRYRVGFVNEVSLYHEFDRWLVYYTDGYKTQFLAEYRERAAALAAMQKALNEGAGGGFTSHFRANSEAAP